MDLMQVSLTFLECSYEGVGTSAGVKPGSVDGYEILSVSTSCITRLHKLECAADGLF
jgi:hypothetical protein